MKKVFLSLLILLICVGSAYSQFDAQFSQYMLHNSSFNPAAVGEDDMIQVTGQLRSQWLGIPNAGKTMVFSINSPFKLQNSKHGIGLSFSDDKVGLFTNQALHLQYAFKKTINDGVLSLGTDIGFISLGFLGDSVYVPTSLGTYHTEEDILIPKSNVTGMSLDLNLGAFYSTSSYYVGLSYLHVNSPTVNWGDVNEFKQYGSLFLTGGYNWVLPDSKFILKPSTLLKTDFVSLQCDVTGRLEYDNKYWGGISYRFQDAVVFLAGISIASGMSLGCSYDLPTSRIISVSPGSLEVVFLYNFEYVFGKRNNKYKSIRIL